VTTTITDYVEKKVSYPTSLYSFFTDPKFIKSTSKYNCVQTAILRYYLTAYTGKRLKTERLNTAIIKKQVLKLRRIEVDSDFDILSHLELIKKGGKMYGKTKTQMKSHVSYGKRFFEFVYSSINSFVTEPKHQDKRSLRYREAIMDKSAWIVDRKNSNRTIFLREDPYYYLPELKDKYPKLKEKKLYQIAKINIDKNFEVINSYAEYKSQSCTIFTVRNNVKKITRFLGWYKSFYQLPVDELDVYKIIPVINPYVEVPENLSEKNLLDLAKKELILKNTIKVKVTEFMKALEKFYDDYLKKSGKGNKREYAQALINLSHFLYKDITDTTEYSKFEDISLINRLRIFMKEISSLKEIKKDKIIPFTWEEIKIVCERLRMEASVVYGFDASKINNINKGYKLTKRQRALRLQDFLAIAFFVVMPPDRQKTIRELNFGKTLKYGVRNADLNLFTDYKDLKEGETPKYYIHLLPHQYKTGKTYGTYWHEINNVKYKNGTTFYDYLDKYLFEGYRDEIAIKETNDLFIREKTRTSFKDGEYLETHFTEFIKNIFLRKTKYPLSPHRLRDIFITHINNQNLDENVRKSIAYMMHHDIQTADRSYNQQSSDEKMSLALEYLDKSLTQQTI